jgi:alkylhydroperoxidase family enzyme
MAWIDTIPPEDASEQLRELYRRVTDPGTGQPDHIMQIHSLHPEGLRAHFELYRAVMKTTPGLSAAEREMIALVVSRTNGCHY